MSVRFARPRLVTLAAATALAAALVAAPAAPAATPPKGHYMCYDYVGGYPTLVAGIWILSKTRYAGEGKKQPGRYRMGRRTKKGQIIRFRGGAYGGWWGYFRRTDGTPVIELRNDDGIVGAGCPRAE
ncbi:MAG TPA: hypothetical protein VHF89_00405 [Solirubrobacteraceae bacterium]|nr:hypothetical protein [Solirubrobacteraceae bacterium]